MVDVVAHIQRFGCHSENNYFPLYRRILYIDRYIYDSTQTFQGKRLSSARSLDSNFLVWPCPSRDTVTPHREQHGQPLY